MSQPKRYRPILNNRKEVVMAEDVSGDWTSLTEYYKLHDKTLTLASDNAALKAEVERLRKAGDALIRICEIHESNKDEYVIRWKAWQDAKDANLRTLPPSNLRK